MRPAAAAPDRPPGSAIDVGVGCLVLSLVAIPVLGWLLWVRTAGPAPADGGATPPAEAGAAPAAQRGDTAPARDGAPAAPGAGLEEPGGEWHARTADSRAASGLSRRAQRRREELLAEIEAAERRLEALRLEAAQSALPHLWAAEVARAEAGLARLRRRLRGVQPAPQDERPSAARYEHR